MEAIKKLKLYGDLSRIFIKYGRHDVLIEAGLLDKEAEEERLDTSNDTAENARRFVKDIEDLGPTFIKLGQLLSTREELFPPEFIKELRKLQDNVSSIPYQDVAEILTSELEVSDKKLFHTFDQKPMATASLAQVHRAKLFNDDEVVVKVQRPHIREVIQNDLALLKRIIHFLDDHSIKFRRYHIINIFEEFKNNINTELSYKEEAYNLVKIHKNLKEFNLLKAPQVYRSYSSERVLVMEYLEGKKLNELTELELADIHGKQILDQLFSAYLKQIFVDGFFHSDPHLGNILYLGNNKLGIIDLGMVTRIGPELRRDLLYLLMSIVQGRGKESAELAWRVTYPVPGVEEDASLFKERITTLVKDQYDRPIERINLGRTLLEVTQISAQCGLYFPQELSSISRTIIYLEEVAQILDPDYNPYRIVQDQMMNYLEKSFKSGNTLSQYVTETLEFKELVETLPRKANTILDDLTNQRFKIRVDALDQENLMKGFQKIANRITAGLILAALIISSSTLMDYESEYTILGYPLLAILTFLIAMIGSSVLLINTLFRDK